MVDHMPLLQTGFALKEQFKQQFNPVDNTREKQMASWKNVKWDGNETLDEFSYRVTQLGKALGVNDQHFLDTSKLGFPLNIYVNLVHIDGMQATLAYGCVKRNINRYKCHI